MSKVHKTIAEAGAHLVESATVIPARYKAAVAKADWEGPSVSKEAEANYQEGITEAITKGLRVKGIHAAGNAKYQKNAAEKGGAVIGTRIAASRGEYESAFSPVLTAMNDASDRAPARTRDFRANINNRLIPVVEAARKAAGK